MTSDTIINGKTQTSLLRFFSGEAAVTQAMARTVCRPSAVISTTFETSQMILRFCNFVIRITQYVQAFDLTKPRTKRAHVAHLPQELLKNLRHDLRIP